MIDTVWMEFNLKHKPFGNCLSSKDEQTGKSFEWRKPVILEGEFVQSKLKVTSLGNGRRIRVEGSYVQFYQGHNAFGTNDLRALCFMVAKSVLAGLNIRIRSGLLDAVLDGDLYRVDINGGFKLGSESGVAATVYAIKESLLGYPRQVESFGNETVYVDGNSNARSAKFYNKGCQMAVVKNRRNYTTLPEQDLIDRYVEHLLRFEVTYGREGLISRNRAKVHDWKPSTASALLRTYLKEMKLKGNITTWKPSEFENRLPPAALRTYLHWKAGFDLTGIYGASTLARHQRKIGKYGISLRSSKPSNMRRVRRIAKVLEFQNMRLKYPRWARVAGKVAAVSK